MTVDLAGLGATPAEIAALDQVLAEVAENEQHGTDDDDQEDRDA